VHDIDGAKRLKMANAIENVKRNGWKYFRLMCLITSLLCIPKYTVTCRFRVTITVELGLLKGEERRPSTIFKKVAYVTKKFNFMQHRFKQKSSVKGKKQINGARLMALD